VTSNRWADDFATWMTAYDFSVSKDTYELLTQGKFAIWGYDKKLRPVLFFDLFSIDKENHHILIEGFHLLCALAYSKMMIPSVNDGILIVIDSCFRHYVDILPVTCCLTLAF
jgi:hypothetical protein